MTTPTPKRMVDDDLARTLPTDFRAFHELFRVEMVKYTFGCVGSLADAEEIVDDAMDRLRENWQTGVLRADSPRRYAYRVLQNRITDHWRRPRVRRELPTDFSDPDHAPVVVHHDPDAAVMVDLWRAIRELPPRQRDSLVLRSLMGMEVADIADRLGITVSTVRGHLHEARKKLAAEFLHGAVDDDDKDASS
ncbi:RNA polymerase sigma factor [Streptodolium elevatio]|uniref:Sigma-70 family RNA polymerase sigma factor n=1 Tax=Streptodolium elevatio TaxID=3157996 RepID=A0ABV3DYI8_9ACTN